MVISSTFTAPTDALIFHQPTTKLLVNDQEIGTGSLYITENNVVWGGGIQDGAPLPTLTLQYPSISLHGVQKEPTPALFMVINYELRLPGLSNVGDGDAGPNDDDDEYDGDEPAVTQLRFVPPNEQDLQIMYNAMCQGQTLHPDPEDEVDDDDNYMDGEDFDEDEMFEDAEETNTQPEEATDRMRQLRIENTNGHCEENGHESDNAED